MERQVAGSEQSGRDRRDSTASTARAVCRRAPASDTMKNAT
jgi:hypothetical protein